MKSILLALALIGGTAAAEPACVPYIPCGTYEGKGAWYDLKGQKEADSDFLEKTVISPVDSNTVSIEEYVYEKDQKPEDGYALKAKFVFQPTGEYSAYLEDGTLAANGACSHDVCTFGFIPWQGKDGKIRRNVNTLRFENGKLKRLLMVSMDFDDANTSIQKSESLRK